MLIQLIRLVINIMKIELAIKTQKAKMKMMKHHGQNISMKMIQETQKQIKHLQLPKILLDTEITDVINSLNSKQMKIINGLKNR